MPLKNASEIYELCRSRNVPVNVDGSRLWNASSATGISIAEYSKHSDNITMCFSKGLCCPIGSVIAGSEKTIAKARHYRKVFGGSWRQGGYFAASCLWALDNILPSLNQDNIKAKILADLLHERGIPIKEKPEINMIFLGEIEGVSTADLTRHLCERGVLILIGRVALHQYIPMDDLEDIANVFEEAIDACKREKAQC